MLQPVSEPPNLDHANAVLETLLAQMQDTPNATEHAVLIRAKLEELGPKVREGDLDETQAYYFVIALGVTKAIQMRDFSVAAYINNRVAHDLQALKGFIVRRRHLIRFSERMTLNQLVAKCAAQLEPLKSCFPDTP